MIGIDEAGRGCVGGSMFLCGVKVIDKEKFNKITELTDSKKMSKKKIEKVYGELLDCVEYVLVKSDAREVDSYGLSECLKNGLMKIVFHFGNEDYLYDGNCNYGLDIVKTEVKADLNHSEVSAASVIAKHSKTLECIELDKEFPMYEFTKHSGYVTKLHKEKIREYGYCSAHRKSYNISL
jgi:ribonuclease HII